MADEIDALERSIAEVLDILPTDWVLVAADSDGLVHSLCSRGMPLWKRKGLLEWDATSYGAQPMWTADDEDDD